MKGGPGEGQSQKNEKNVRKKVVNFKKMLKLSVEKCVTDVCAVSVHIVFKTTTKELKGKATTRISRDCQLQAVTVNASRQCACSRQ